MPLPDPNAAVGVPTTDPTPADWTDSFEHVHRANTYNYWYVDLPAPYNIRIMDVSDHVHDHWFVHLNHRFPRNRRPSKPHRPWSIRNIVVHQFAGGTGEVVGDARHMGAHGFYHRLQQLVENKSSHTVIARGGGTEYGHSTFGYHFAIPYFADEIGGRVLVYKMQDLSVASPHTGGHNSMSIGVSLMGHPRTYTHPNGRYHTLQTGDTREGLSSELQHKALRGVVRYLQDFYRIPDSQVHGHFTHSANKRECPGYDAERYVLDLEDRLAHAHSLDAARAAIVVAQPRYCYPVALDGNAVPGLRRVWERDANGQDSDNNANLTAETATAVEYMTNARSRPGGAFPYGRRPIWHNGCHLHPDSAGEDVYAVRDGWVIATNLKKEISYQQPDGTTAEFGSASWILMQHCDPPVWDARTIWRPRVGERRPYPLNYYSLYMHVKPLENAAAADNFEWLKELERRDSALHQLVTTTDATHAFGSLAIPVRTGDVIAAVGEHASFAIAPDGSAVERDRQPLLHFEMFSKDNLLEKFGFNAGVARNWTVNDGTRNPLVEPRHLDPRGNYGDVDLFARLNTRRTELEGFDPHEERADLAPQTEHAEFQDAMSKIVARHISEWAAEWSQIPRAVWGGNRAGSWHNARDQWDLFNEHYVDEMQWLHSAWATRATRRQLQLSTQWIASMRPWPPEHQFYYFHPIRMINWLNGLSRGLEHPRGYYNGTGPRDDASTDPNQRTSEWRITPRFDWEQSLL
jgi:N-acetylmuramoyl-L-alanine amidase